MKKLLMVLPLVVCATIGSAQELRRSARALGSRVPRPIAFAAKGRGTITTNGVEWTYKVIGGGVFLGSGGRCFRAMAKLGDSQNTTETLIVPETLEGMPVHGIESHAFFCCSNLTSVVIPSSVTNIGQCAFQGCSGLTSMAIPSNVTSIGFGAFSGCSGLTRVMIPSSVTSIGDWAFSGCNGLTSFLVDAYNPSYGSRNGMLCSRDGGALIRGTLPVGGNGDVSIPSGVTSIGLAAFSCCSNLTSVVMSEGTTSIGDSAFSGCSGLTNVTIPSSVTRVGDSAFSGCSGLTSVTISASVKSIGSYAFSGCSGLTNVTIPSSVTKIGKWTFSGCSGLSSFIVSPENPKYSSVNGLLYTKDGKTLIAGVNGDVIIPEGVTSIGDGAFSGRCGLASVTIPSSATDIGFGVFSGCSGLSSFIVSPENPKYSLVNGLLYTKDGKTLVAGVNGDVIIPEGVTRIGASAFEGCSGLKSVKIPSSVTSIGDRAFSSCSGPTDVTIPSTVTRIGVAAFDGCPIRKAVVPGVVSNSARTDRNRPVSFSKVGEVNLSQVTNVVVADGTRVIRSWSFSGCRELTSVTIPSSVTSIGACAFFGCSNLTSVMIPVSVTSIGVSAFNGTPFYEKQPEGMVILGGGVLYKFKGECSSSVMIPSNVTCIGDRAFAGCNGLESVAIPSSVTSIGVSAFEGCGNLTSVTISSSVTNIGWGAFTMCDGLKSVTIPSNLANVVKSVFGQEGKSLSTTNGMTTVVFEKSGVIKNAGARRGGGLLGGSLRARRLQRQQAAEVDAVKQREDQKKAKDAERQAQAKREKLLREVERAEQRRNLLLIQEALKKTREARARTAAEGAQK